MIDPAARSLAEAGEAGLPGLLGLTLDEAAPGRVRMSLPLRPEVFAPNGYVHGGAIVALADTACGYGTQLGLPEGSSGFTTIGLTSSFIGAAREGLLSCEAVRTHGGRTTQVWDATVSGPDGRTVALVRVTQLILR